MRVFVRCAENDDRVTIEMLYTDPFLRNLELHLRSQAAMLSQDEGDASSAGTKSEVNKRKQQAATISAHIQRLQSTKQYSFKRLRTEDLGTCLRRMETTVEQYRVKILRKVGKFAQDHTDKRDSSRLALFERSSGQEVAHAISNDEAWCNERILRVNDAEYTIVRNPPTVDKVRLPNDALFVNVTVFVFFEVRFANPQRIRIEWYFVDRPKTNSETSDADDADVDEEAQQRHQPEHVGLSLRLRPEHAGKFLRLRIIAVNDDGLHGPAYTVTSARPVSYKPTYRPNLSVQSNTNQQLESGSASEDASLFLFQRRALRHGLTRPLGASCGTEPFRFRVVSYNLLADLYADADFSRSYLFPHCPDERLALAYREPLMHSEVHAYNADVYCFQELDRKVYERLRSRVLSSDMQYANTYRQKHAELPEGCGIFFRTDRFELVEERTLNLATAIFEPGSIRFRSRKRAVGAANASDSESNATNMTSGERPKKGIDMTIKTSEPQEADTIVLDTESLAETCEQDERDVGALRKLFRDLGLLEETRAFDVVEGALRAKVKLLERWLMRKVVLHCAVLRPKSAGQSAETGPEQLLLVANTHLYFHPNAAHVRTLQSWICTQFIHALRVEYSRRNAKLAFVFCGDFNAQPDSLAYDLLTRGSVSPTDACWFSAGREEHFAGGAALTHQLPLVSGTGTPTYTTLVPGFRGCLDYCFYDAHALRLLRTIPLPTHQEICQLVALPNEEMPSDHMAVICELELAQPSAQTQA